MTEPAAKSRQLTKPCHIVSRLSHDFQGRNYICSPWIFWTSVIW